MLLTDFIEIPSQNFTPEELKMGVENVVATLNEIRIK